MDDIRGNEEKLLYLMDHVADVTVGLIDALALRMHVEAAAERVEKSLVGNAKPGAPDGCGANDDPGNGEAAGADDLLAFHFAGAVEGEGSVFVVAPWLRS